MANDLGTAIDALRGILGDDAEGKLQNVISQLSPPTHHENAITPQPRSSGIDANTLQYISQLRSMFDELSQGGDDRSNLLMSLRPYMSSRRQRSIDSALKIIALTRLTNAFGKL